MLTLQGENLGVIDTSQTELNLTLFQKFQQEYNPITMEILAEDTNLTKSQRHIPHWQPKYPQVLIRLELM